MQKWLQLLTILIKTIVALLRLKLNLFWLAESKVKTIVTRRGLCRSIFCICKIWVCIFCDYYHLLLKEYIDVLSISSECTVHHKFNNLLLFWLVESKVKTKVTRRGLCRSIFCVCKIWVCIFCDYFHLLPIWEYKLFKLVQISIRVPDMVLRKLNKVAPRSKIIKTSVTIFKKCKKRLQLFIILIKKL